MSSTRTEQERYESLLKPDTDAVENFRKQYRLYRSVPGVQRTITDGELMAACAFHTYEQCVYYSINGECSKHKCLRSRQLPCEAGIVLKANGF